MTDNLHIAILGAAGRMGRALVKAVAETDGAVLGAALEHAGNPALGQDAGLLAGLPPQNISLTDDVVTALARCSAAIEFSSPAATVAHAALAADRGIAYVAGTTGMSAVDEDALVQAARRIPVVYAANFSVGMNILSDLVRRTAATLGVDFDIEISEMHHRHKVDAPSGSAIMLGRAAAAGRGVALDVAAIRGRDGITGERPIGGIGFVSLRGGDVPGDHTVIFAGPGERLELSHRAGGREIFARGAVRAALWAATQPPGLYSMRDVLGL